MPPTNGAPTPTPLSTRPRVALQGEAGSFSEKAAQQHFGPDVDLQPSTTFQEVFEKVSSGEADYAFGWMVQTRNGTRVIWHNGSNTMWYAVVAFNAAADRGVVLVSNGSINARAAMDAAAMEIITSPPTSPLPAADVPTGAVFSPDRSHLAYLANGSTPAMSSSVDIHVRRVRDGADMKVATLDGVVNRLMFSADGATLVFSTQPAGEAEQRCMVSVSGREPVQCR